MRKNLAYLGQKHLRLILGSQTFKTVCQSYNRIFLTLCVLIPHVSNAQIIFLGAIVSPTKPIAVVGTVDGTKHITIGEEASGYTLDAVRYGRAYFSKDNNQIVLYPGQTPATSIESSPIEIIDGIDVKDTRIRLTTSLRNYFSEKEGLLTIMMQAGAQAVMQDGEIIGFRLLEIDRGSIYDIIGLKDRDVILSIDGIPITGALMAIKLLHSIRRADDFSFTRLRNGITRKMDVAGR